MGRRHRSLEARLQRAWRSTTIYASSPFAASCGPFDAFQPFNKIFSNTADIYIAEQMQQQQQQQQQCFECVSPNHSMQQQQKQQQIQHVQQALGVLSTPSQGAGESIINILQVRESEFTTNLAKRVPEESCAASEHEQISQENEVTKTNVEHNVSFDHFMQQPSAPESHSKPQGAGVSTINFLQVCESEFTTKLAKEVSEEASAASEHEKFSQENEVTKTTDEQDVNYKTQEFKSQDKTGAEFSASRETADSVPSDVLEDYAKINDRCIAKLKTYSERKGRSEAEIKGLKEALSILEDAFKTFKTFYEQFEKRLRWEVQDVAVPMAPIGSDSIPESASVYKSLPNDWEDHMSVDSGYEMVDARGSPVKIGAWVCADNLTGAIHLNGQLGVVISFQGERVGVDFGDEHGVKAIKSMNLIVEDDEESKSDYTSASSCESEGY